MDATRTEHDFLCRCVEAAIKAGATTVNIPDTVGYATPDEFAALIRMIIERVPGADRIVFSTHCHNDLGLAVANSLAGVGAGARQVECAVNGLGERAGNAALEEIVMAIRTRGDVMPFWTGIDTTMLTRASKLVSRVTAFPVQYNKAIVGRNAFAHESGIHQDGVLKHAETFEIMTPESVGLKESSLVMGKHSGRHAFREKLKELGYELGDNAFEDAFVRFKALADRKKHVYDEDIEALVDQEIASAHDRIKVVALTVIAGTGGPQKATITLDVDGKQHTHESTGDGPVDATFRAIKAIVPHEARLAALSGERGDGRHRRAGRGDRAARGRRQDRDRAGLRHRHHGRLGARLCQRAEQAAWRARRGGSPRRCSHPEPRLRIGIALRTARIAQA